MTSLTHDASGMVKDVEVAIKEWLTFPELVEVSGLVTARLQELRQEGIENLHAELEKKASELGCSLTEFLRGAQEKNGQQVAVMSNSTELPDYHTPLSSR